MACGGVMDGLARGGVLLVVGVVVEDGIEVERCVVDRTKWSD